MLLILILFCLFSILAGFLFGIFFLKSQKQKQKPSISKFDPCLIDFVLVFVVVVVVHVQSFERTQRTCSVFLAKVIIVIKGGRGQWNCFLSMTMYMTHSIQFDDDDDDQDDWPLVLWIDYYYRLQSQWWWWWWWCGFFFFYSAITKRYFIFLLSRNRPVTW